MRYWTPSDVPWTSPDLPGVRIYALGPPRDEALLKKTFASNEVYHLATGEAENTAFFGAATVQQLCYQFDPQCTSQEATYFNNYCGACPELLTGSKFLQELDARGMALPGVTYTDVMTQYDELVQPYTSGYLAARNVTNVVLQTQCSVDFSDHLTVAFDPTAGQDMLNALDPANAQPVPCVPVIAGYGALYPPPGG